MTSPGAVGTHRFYERGGVIYFTHPGPLNALPCRAITDLSPAFAGTYGYQAGEECDAGARRPPSHGYGGPPACPPKLSRRRKPWRRRAASAGSAEVFMGPTALKPWGSTGRALLWTCEMPRGSQPMALLC